MHCFLRGIVLTLPVLALCGCLGRMKSRAPRSEQPPPLTQITEPKTTRAQKPEPPPIVALPPARPGEGEVSVRVVAYVNTMPIFESEVREGLVMRLRELEGLSDTERERKLKMMRAAEIEKLIEREVVMDAANARLKKMPGRVMEDLQREANKEFERRMKALKEAYKINSDEQLRSFFSQQGMSLVNFRRSVERSFISMEFMRNVIFPKLQFIPVSEVLAYYESHPEEFTESDRVKWQDLAIDAGKFASREAARQYAEQVAARLRSGANFSSTAKELQQAGYNYLLSDAGIGERPGEIRPNELERAVLAVPEGQVGGPVEIAGGFHLIKVNERKRAGKRPLDGATQTEIRSKLQNLLADKEYKRLVEEMKEKALIQRLEP